MRGKTSLRSQESSCPKSTCFTTRVKMIGYQPPYPPKSIRLELGLAKGKSKRVWMMNAKATWAQRQLRAKKSLFFNVGFTIQYLEKFFLLRYDSVLLHHQIPPSDGRTRTEIKDQSCSYGKSDFHYRLLPK